MNNFTDEQCKAMFDKLKNRYGSEYSAKLWTYIESARSCPLCADSVAECTALVQANMDLLLGIVECKCPCCEKLILTKLSELYTDELVEFEVQNE